MSPGPDSPILDPVARWRTRAVRIVLALLAVAGLPAWGTVIANGLRNGSMSILLWIYLVIYLSLTALAILPRIDYRWRIWGLLILGYANGCASLARLGLTGSGRLYLLAMPVFTTALVGTRAGLATAFLSLATYFFFGAQVPPAARPSWLEAGTALTAFVLTTAVLLIRFTYFQTQTLRSERRARSELEEAQAQLEAYSRTLETKVMERTARLAEAKKVAETASRRFEQELLFAGRIQASFMASELPQMDAWQCAAALVPARETSGDFYDVFPLDNGRYGLLIADVVDKGVGAALFMALCWALLHTYARRYPDEPERVLAATNLRILRDTHAGQFVTVFYGVFEPQSGRLCYANAGHPPPYHYKKGELQALTRTGIPLGILEDEKWEQRAVYLQPGELCLLYTDGITEAHDQVGDLFESQRLREVVLNNCGRPAPEIRDTILQSLEHFVGDTAQSDDVTLLVLTHS